MVVDSQYFAKGLSFLVVEDEAMIAMMTELMLWEAGALDVVIAASIAETLSLLDDRKFDVAIFDRKLTDGISYPAAVVAKKRGILVIIASGWHSSDLPVELEDAIVLPKPFALPQLERAVGEALSRRGAN